MLYHYNLYQYIHCKHWIVVLLPAKKFVCILYYNIMVPVRTSRFATKVLFSGEEAVMCVSLIQLSMTSCLFVQKCKLNSDATHIYNRYINNDTVISTPSLLTDITRYCRHTFGMLTPKV